jgi:hypothetical protein
MLGAACSLEAGSLDLGPDHVFAQKGLSVQKEFMVVATRIRASSQTAKAVQIKLALEGSQLGLPKVSAIEREMATCQTPSMWGGSQNT